jgi:hypothetical protein
LVDAQTLRNLRDSLSQGRAKGSITLREFGQLLGRAIGRQPYSRSYVHQLLHGVRPITPRIEQATRVLMSTMETLDEGGWVDSEGQPLEKMRAARAAGVRWEELYGTDAEVRGFVDGLMDCIVRSQNP